MREPTRPRRTPVLNSQLIVGIGSLGVPNAPLAAAVTAAGGTGVLDLGAGDRRARAELARLGQLSPDRLAVRVAAGCSLHPADLPGGVRTVVFGRGAPWRVADLPQECRVLVEVTTIDEARAAASAGAHGLIARGGESGDAGLSEYVLLQQLLALDGLPVWASGVGPRTAAAAVLGGAAGVVLDVALGSLRESDVAVDDPLARQFAARFGTVARAVAGVRRAIVEATQRPFALGTGAALAQAFGTELPVAQGPMTRVSDRAGFALTVAEAGGLPFLALALSSGSQARNLLREVRDSLGDRPWGVGVLGFVPDELRAAQLDAIREVRPRVALIAGGYPDQAAALEADGISTFLHVTSPDLLRQFLDAGARKFVFEGAECGGHVGPRTSFALWEAQLDVLQDGPSDVQVLFAGGIHDARSAAMVSALAGPLVDRGAAVGVLMGTAYLFTEEAVTTGAIQPLFQSQARAAENTALLETGPGHATRCLPSPFVSSFADTRQSLAAQGVPKREIWQRLEDLNVGRLRIASKGLRRDGAELVDVDEAEQLEQGLFMAGQVAALREGITTVAGLHGDVVAGAAAFYERRSAELRTPPDASAKPQPVDVAVVGMACAFPGADDLAAYWANTVGNVDAIGEVPADRWATEIYRDQTPSRWGGFLAPRPFDPLRYGIPPATLPSVEPAQLLALDVARRALADAGYEDGGFDRARTSVIFGAEAGSDLANANVLRMVLPSYLDSVPPELQKQLPPLSEDSFPGTLANVIAGRIANRLDLGGANYTVDAACASSLAAVDVACKELVAGTSDVVLAGAVDLHNAINDYLLFASVGALSATGRSKTFDAAADGIALGEGVACLVLKRRADAERDGDRIYAVIEGVGNASDGRSLGLTAPRPEGQRAALDRAYERAGVSPARVGLVEAHGTGTVVGDRTELGVLDAAFTAAGAAPGNCALGSVKSQIGHTKCAAGLAGLIRAALAVHTGVKPPTQHICSPNPAWQVDSSPFTFHRSATPWTQPPADRVAGVSAFGFGGTNFHVVLRGHSSAETVRHGMDEWPVELFVFRGREDVSWLRSRVADNDAAGRPWRLRDLARSAALRADRSDEPVRVVVIAADLDELSARLDAAVAGVVAEGVHIVAPAGGKLAVLFPGQGSQHPGMLAELFVAFPELRAYADPSVVAAMFPPAAFEPDGVRAQQDRLRDTRMAQPALGIAGLAVHHLLSRLHVVPDMLAGHSYGELVALCAAGAFDADTLLALSTARAQTILDAAGDDPGTMAAVAADPAEVEPLLPAGVVVANYNSPRQTVISGLTPAVAAAVDALREAGLAAKPIPVACAFHSPVVESAGPAFAKVLAGHRIEAPDRPVWSNRRAAPYADDVQDELAAQIGSPVRFADEIEAMYAAGARTFVEAGPGRVLSGLVDAVLGERPHSTIPCDGGISGFLDAIAQLAVAGVPLRVGWLTGGRDAVDVSEAIPPARPGWTVDGHLVRTADGEPLAGGLAPARRVPVTAAAPPTGSSRDELVGEFIRSSRELVAAQRDVLLGYLGPAPAATPTGAAPTGAAPQGAVTGALEGAPTRDEPVRSAEQPVPPQLPAHEEPTDVLAVVLGVIAGRTGYPVDMIEPGLDLEADLSVDSIKRAEIAAELCKRLGIGAQDARFSALVRQRTARGMAEMVAEPSEPASVAQPAEPVPVSAPEALVEAPQRFTLEAVEVVAGAREDPAGRRIAVIGGYPSVADRLRELGASVGDTVSDRLDGLVFLGMDGESALPAGFPVIQSALRAGARQLIAVDEPGMRGLIRSIAVEYPDVRARLVDDVEHVVDELHIGGAEPVVVRTGDRRHAFAVRRADLDVDAAADVGAALGLNGDSVVLLVGGARGITAQVAVALAATSGCTVEVAGRTVPAEAPEDHATAAAADLPALRTALAGLGGTDRARIDTARIDTVRIDKMAREILARREVAATLRQLRRHSPDSGYRILDVRDELAVTQLVKQVHAERGRLDGVVYAAGVIEDRLLADKTEDSFRRVYSTKVDGLSALLGGLADLPAPPGFVVAFGSIAAVVGNRGQSDYAAANDAADRLTAQWGARHGARALTVHWGPWAPEDEHGGMVSPELAREYARRAVSLIEPSHGVAALMRELAFGPPDARSVIYSAPGPWTGA